MRRNRLIYIGITLGIILITILSNMMIRNSYVQSVELTINYPSNDTVLYKPSILQNLQRNFGNFLSQKRKDISTNTIKQYLETQNFVQQASVSITITGILKIDIIQRLAVVRVFTKDKHTYYIDQYMNILRTDTDKSVNAIVANGDITDKASTVIDTIKNKQLFAIYKLSMMINQDSILRYQIDQIVKQDTGYILVPKIGDYYITLGEKQDWQEELLRLHWLYKKAFLQYGWENYSHIDLRFKNQVICTKKQ